MPLWICHPRAGSPWLHRQTGSSTYPFLGCPAQIWDAAALELVPDVAMSQCDGVVNLLSVPPHLENGLGPPGQLVTDTRNKVWAGASSSPMSIQTCPSHDARMPQDVCLVQLLWKIMNRRTKQLQRPIFHFRVLKGFKA